MKLNNILGLFAAIVLFSSCVKEVIKEVDTAAEGVAETVSVFYLSDNRIDTKTSITSLASNTFVLGDKIKVYSIDGSSSADFTFKTIESENVFVGTSPNSTSFYGLYPSNSEGAGFDGTYITATVPAEQQAVDSTFNAAANVSVARAEKRGEKYYMDFKNVCCLLKFIIEDDNNADAIIVKGNNNEYLTGTVKIDPATGKWSDVSNGSKQVKLTPPAGHTEFPAGTYYICILPQTFNKGVSVKVEHSLGSYHFKKGSKTQLSMNRNKIFELFQGDLSPYTEVAMLPPLANHDGNTNPNAAGQSVTLMNFKKVVRIEFITEATDEEYNYATDHNQCAVLEGSDVLGYKGTSKGNAVTSDVDDLTLFIFTKKKAFSVSDDNRAYSRDEASKLFNNYTKVEEIVGLNKLDVTFVKNFSNMFYRCDALRSIDISEWDTSSAENMRLMFSEISGAALTTIKVGEYFTPAPIGTTDSTYPDGWRTNMFGIKNTPRDPRIIFQAPSNVEDLESEFPLQIDQQTYFSGGVFENVRLSDIPYYVDESDYSVHTLTFDLGGLGSAITALSTIQVGLNRFEPADGNLVYADTHVKYEGREHALYNYTVTDSDKTAKKVTIRVRTRAWDSSFENVDRKGNIHLSASQFDDYDSSPITILTARYWIDLYTDSSSGRDQTAWISDLGTDYTSQGWPIVGQSAKVTVKVNDLGVDPSVFDHLTINGLSTTKGASEGGYTSFTTTEAHVISYAKERKALTVTAHLKDGSTKDLKTKANVDVYGPSKGSAITRYANYSNSKMYFIESKSGYYLTTITNGSSLSLSGRSDPPGLEGVWKFGSDGGASSTIYLFKDDTKFVKQNNANAPSLATSSTWTIGDGLTFSYTYRPNLWTNTTYYLTLESAAAPSVKTTAQTWTAYEVTFTAP